MLLDDFEFNGYRASDYGVRLKKQFSLAGATPSYVSTAKILGRSGDLIEWDGSYQNRRGYAYCRILDSDAITKFDNFVSGLLSSPEYKKLVVDSIPDVYMLAAVSESPKTEFGGGVYNAFDIVFNCKPQKYLLSGQNLQSFTSAGTITNPTSFDALPLITVHGSGAGSVTVGETKVQVKGLTDQITLDCDTMNAYKKVGDGASENKNNLVTAPEFPRLHGGDNAILFDGGITKIEIIPRWWKL